MANKILVNTSTAVTWLASGGTHLMSCTSLANGAGRIGDQHDLGAGVTDRLFEWEFRFRTATTPTVGEVVRVYIATGRDGTYTAGSLGISDAAVSGEDLLRNADFIGAVEIDAASTTKDFVRRGLLYLRSRFVSPVIWNASGVAFSSTGSHFGFTLWPSSDEVQ